LGNKINPDQAEPTNSSKKDELTVLEVASRTVTGSLFNVSAQVITLILGLTRSILLARLLLPKDFGIVILAVFFVNIAASVSTFGLNPALIQRENAPNDAISTHFILRTGLSILSFLLLLGCIPLFQYFYSDRPLLIPIILALSAIGILSAISSTPTVLLQRDMAFRRLALLNILSSATMLISAVYMAWRGLGPWSLVIGEQFVGVMVSTVGVWIYRPPWRLSIRFNRSIAREYLHFGKYVLANSQLNLFLDQFDDFWSASSLGSTAGGYYSKAYEFARYPRRIIAKPLQPVFLSAYARLRSNRKKLSKAFFRLNSLIVRIGFLLTLILFLIAPEFIELFLTAKWLPMVAVFRLMLLYTLLDPLIVTAGNLTIAIGQPHLLTRVKVVQLVIFIPSVIILARLLNIEGVALAANLMLLIGIILIFRYVRKFVDFSLRKMFTIPIFAFILSGLSVWFIGLELDTSNLWLVMLVKAVLASTIYSLILLTFEHKEYRTNLKTIIHLLGIDRLKGYLRWI
jgi:O-antigen/teichoic acid export membrane protein